MAKSAADFLNSLNPDPLKAGKTLLVLNALGMIFGNICNTTATAVDKNTSPEDKKFLVPAGVVTGITNIGLYYAMTNKLINNLKNEAESLADTRMEENVLTKNAKALAEAKIAKAEKGIIFGIGKKSKEYVTSMKNTLFKDGNITEDAKKLYKNNLKASAGVLGAFIGAIVGCSIITPIVRDVSAYFVQKRMEKLNPNLKDKPYMPYFEPTGISNNNYGRKMPLSMKNYMHSTSNMTI